MLQPETLHFSVGEATTLRPVVADDAEGLFALTHSNRAHLRRWLPWLDGTQQTEDTRAYLNAAIEQARAGLGGVWAIEQSGALCGVAGFNRIEPSNRTCEIGYWLSAEQQGKGIMTRCVERLIRHAFDDLSLNRITIPVAVENQPSRAVAERLGFRREGVLREAEWLYDHFVDHVLYALVRSEWRRPSDG